MYASPQDLFWGKNTLGLEWGSNPQPHISSVMFYQLSYQAPCEQHGGEEGIQVLVLGAHYIKYPSLMEHPWVTMLSPLALN